MINQTIENAVKFIREARDEADGLGEHIMFFVSFLMIGFGFTFIAFTLCSLVFIAPKVFIPLYFSIFVLWHGYKRL